MQIDCCYEIMQVNSNQSTLAAGEVASLAEERKCSAYSTLPVTHSFTPVIIETTDAVGPKSIVVCFFKELVKHQTGFVGGKSKMAVNRTNSLVRLHDYSSYSYTITPSTSTFAMHAASVKMILDAVKSL